MPRVTPVAVCLALAACGYLHEELPPGVDSGAVIEFESPAQATANASIAASTSPTPPQSADRAGVGTAPTAIAAAPTSIAVAPAPTLDLEHPPQWSALRAAAAPSADGPLSPDPALARGVEAAVLAALEGGDPNQGPGPGVVTLLSKELALPESAVRGTAATAVRSADVTGDGRPDLLVAVPSPKLPLFVFEAGDTGWRAVRLPPEWPVSPEQGPTGQPQLERVEDVTGDGVSDIVYSFYGMGASSSYTDLHIASGTTDGGFKDVFSTLLDDWAGPAPSSQLWSLQAGQDGTEVMTSCAALGPFDQKLLPHPVLRRTYRFDPLRGAFVLAGRDIDPPASTREAANVAEMALREGDLDAAAEGFEDLIGGLYPVEDPGVDWRGLAFLRLGILHALAGRSAQAQIAMGNVVSGNGPLAAAASRFVEAYSDPDKAPQALAAMLGDAPDLAAATYADSPQGLGLPLSVPEVLWPGYALGAWLQERGASTLGDEPATTLRIDLGLDVTDGLATDLDGDGSVEVLVLLREAQGAPDAAAQPVLWLLLPRPGGVTAHRLDLGATAIDGLVDLPGGHRGVRLAHAGIQPSVIGWTGTAVTLHGGTAPYALLGYHSDFDPRPGHEPCRVR